MAWHNGPDPYTYERIGTDPIVKRPVYVASRDGREICVIEPVRASTDTKIVGTRQRRIGNGRDEFRMGGEPWWNSFVTRREVAERAERNGGNTAHDIQLVRDRLADQVGTAS